MKLKTILKLILGLGLLTPAFAIATTTVPWQTTNNTSIFPSLINGVQQNVGIGTKAADAHLHIVAPFDGNTAFHITDDTGFNDNLKIYDNGVLLFAPVVHSAGSIINFGEGLSGSTGASPFFLINPDSANTGPTFGVTKDTTSQFIIDTNGNVGIATTTPDAPLSIFGHSKITVTGSQVPDLTGTYVYQGLYNNEAYYLGPNGYIWSRPANDYWFVSPVLGDETNSFYHELDSTIPPGVTSWLPQRGASGSLATTLSNLFDLNGLGSVGFNAGPVSFANGVGIGTGIPAAPLEVIGKIMLNPSLYAGFAGTALQLYTDSSPRAHIDSGIQDFGLTISSLFTGGTIVFQTGGANDRMIIDSSGNVGIGTSSPYAALSVVGNTISAPTLVVQEASSQTANVQEWQNNSGTVFDHIDNLGRLIIGTGAPTGTELLRVNGDVVIVGGFYTGGIAVNNSSGYFLVGGEVMLGSNGAVTEINHNPFFTQLGLFSNNTERVRIDASGNVGVSTSTPDSTLDVNGTFRLEGDSSVVTGSISGAIVGLGCDSADTTVSGGLASTTAFVTTPESYPGDGLNWFSYLLNATTIRTKVCSDVSTSPAASIYVVKIIK